MTTTSEAKPYSPFMADELLTRLNDHAKSDEVLLSEPGAHFDKLGIGELDLMLTNRSGFQDNQIERALSVFSGTKFKPEPSVAERLKACLFLLGDERVVGAARTYGL